jgi:hypothetical protein
MLPARSRPRTRAYDALCQQLGRAKVESGEDFILNDMATHGVPGGGSNSPIYGLVGQKTTQQ